MVIIAGLGNPTKEYENTRHNIGFMAVDALADKYNISVMDCRHRALVGKGVIGGTKVVLVKPLTYMNLSGEAIRAVSTSASCASARRAVRAGTMASRTLSRIWGATRFCASRSASVRSRRDMTSRTMCSVISAKKR